MPRQYSSGRRLGASFYIVVALIAAVAGTAAYIVAGRLVDGGTSGPGSGQPGASAPGGGADGEGGNPGQSSSKPGTASGKGCPELTDQAARQAGSPGGLKQVLYVRTEKSEAWVCRDSAGKLFYQGHSPRSQPFEAATSNVSLFLTDVVAEGEGFLATNRTSTGITKYHLSRDTLRVENPDVTEAVIFFEG